MVGLSITDLVKNDFYMVFNPFIHNRSDKKWTFGRSGFKGSGFHVQSAKALWRI
jgi:hypothetical protein